MLILFFLLGILTKHIVDHSGQTVEDLPDFGIAVHLAVFVEFLNGKAEAASVHASAVVTEVRKNRAGEVLCREQVKTFF